MPCLSSGIFRIFCLPARAAFGAVFALTATCGIAAAPPAPPPVVLTYADLADLADRAPSVVHVQVRKAAQLDPARAAGVRPGWARVYVEARILGLLSGPPLTGAALRYLVDVPLDARGKLPKLAKRDMLVFARVVSGVVAGRPGELQLIAPDAQVPWDAATEVRLRGVLTQLLAAGAPGRISRVQEAIFVPGTLAGEGETQMFLATADGEPASITVVHRPGEAARWSVSFSEVLDSSGTPPPRETLAWYRLACFLPATLDPAANVSATPDDQARAGADYALVRQELGACPRTRN